MRLVLYGTASSEGFPSMFCNCKHCTKARRLAGKHSVKTLRKRTCSCVDDKIMIDFGPDVFSQTGDGLPLASIHHLLVTHSHADHFAVEDLHYLIEPFATEGVGELFHIYGNRAVIEKYNAAHGANAKMQQAVKLHEVVAGEQIVIEDYTITPIPTFHDAKEDCFLYIIEHAGKTLFYAQDSARFPEYTFAALKGYHVDLMVADCTSLEIGGHFKNHMGLPDVKYVQERMLAEGILSSTAPIVITHFAHTFNPIQDNVEALAKPYNYISAYDGIELNI